MPICTVAIKDKIPHLDILPPACQDFASAKARDEADDEHVTLTAGFQNLSSRVDRLLAFGKEAKPSHSETLQACIVSLRTRMPLVLRQTKQLIDGAGNETRLVCRLRSTLALFRAIQYVDRIQEGMDPELNDGLDKQLRTVLDGLYMASLSEAFKNDLAFRISPWVPSVLSFDLPLGESAHATLPRQGSKLPLVVGVEPVVEFRADDLASISYAHHAARACKVTIVKCQHVARDFGLGAGMIGEATICVHVSPLEGSSGNPKSQVWGQDMEVKCLHIKEARV
jgi:hypothetical protein